MQVDVRKGNYEHAPSCGKKEMCNYKVLSYSPACTLCSCPVRKLLELFLLEISVSTTVIYLSIVNIKGNHMRKGFKSTNNIKAGVAEIWCHSFLFQKDFSALCSGVWYWSNHLPFWLFFFLLQNPRNKDSNQQRTLHVSNSTQWSGSSNIMNLETLYGQPFMISVWIYIGITSVIVSTRIIWGQNALSESFPFKTNYN